ncbi:MAG: hypothetical protein Q9193_006364, partial [Seirophora villosa]
MRQIAIAVIGTSGSGKSTFIQHALDLKKSPNSRNSTKKVSLEGVISILRILEIDTDEVEITPDGALRWPLIDANGSTRKIDGAVVVYSIIDVGSTKPLPELLLGPILWGQSNRPPALSDINRSDALFTMKAQDFNAQHSRIWSDAPCSPADADQTTSSTTMGDAATDPQMSSSRCFHGAKAIGNVSGTNKYTDVSARGRVEIQSTFHGCLPSTSAGSTELESPMVLTVPDANDGDDDNWQHAASRQSLGAQADAPADAKPKTATLQQPAPADQGNGVNFEGLVDRLLSRPTSRADTSFVSIFLCLYRKFAAPSALLAAIISRIESVNLRRSRNTIRLTTQLRYLGVMVTWLYGYPGDFAHPSTLLRMSYFVSALASQRQFSMAVKEISSRLDDVSKDDDTYWAFSDTSRCTSPLTDGLLTTSSIRGVSPTTSAQTPIEGESIDDWGNDQEVRATKRGSAAPSTTSTSSRSNLSFQASLKPMESTQAQVRLPKPSFQPTLSKIHWHLFMELSNGDLARELTRIDWALFSSIRPRDLLRHVSLCEEDKMKCKDLQNKLRQLNNYNSLGAVVAGINGTAVHRLSQTRELIPYDVQKQFMRLEILMGTQKSHFPYRLAWSNTSTERIPFLPLHCRDLASAEEGNPTFVGGNHNRINWKKFEILGDVILSIQRSQSIPYTSIMRNESVQRLIQDVKFTKDED